MANVLINETSLTGIADAIRAKKGASAQYLPSEMGAEIASIQTFKPEETFNVTPTTSQQTITPSTGYVFSGGTVNPIYAEISTSAGMDATLASTNKGKMYKYTGTTNTKYTNGRLYVVEEDIEPLTTPLNFTANTAGSTVTLTKQGSPAWTGSYSTDGITWNLYIPGTTGAITLANIGDKVYFKGDISADFNDSNYLNFVMTGSIAASGNCNSMYVSNNFESLTTLTYKYCYYMMFYNCTSLTTPPTLPATTLADSCYGAMFGDCTSLTVAPSLPATTLASECYIYMFCNCTSLTTAPILPAIILIRNCYTYMFTSCTSLTIAPALPATTLAEGCYIDMFAVCTSLTVAPALPATTLAQECYAGMFEGCTSLTTIPALPATTLAQDCYTGMFYECTSLQVNDSEISGIAEQVWTLPTSGTLTNTYEQLEMFTNCAGTRSSDDMAGVQGQLYTYYTQNQPV